MAMRIEPNRAVGSNPSWTRIGLIRHPRRGIEPTFSRDRTHLAPRAPDRTHFPRGIGANREAGTDPPGLAADCFRGSVGEGPARRPVDPVSGRRPGQGLGPAEFLGPPEVGLVGVPGSG